jgi:hypothetical protein
MKWADAQNCIARTKRQYLNHIKESRGCERCGFKGPAYVFDFHHRDPATKLYTLSDRYAGLGQKKLDAEVAKCEVLCANCHREVEHG